MASPEERKEISDLHDLFGHSDVPRGMFLKFEVAKHNRNVADKGRQEKDERQRLLQERQEQQNQRIQELRRVRGERDQEAVTRMKAQKTADANAIKQAEQQWEAQRMAAQTALKHHVRDRGSADFHNARLAEQEAKMLQDRRNKAQAEYDAYKQHQRATHEATMQARRGLAGKMRQDVENAHSGASAKLANMKGSLANRAREDKQAWKEQLARNEEARLKRAQENRKHAEDVRQRARKNMANQTKSREQAGTSMQKKLDADAEKAKADLFAYKKRLREERYKSRYASTEEAKALEQSTFRKLYGGMLNNNV